MAHKFKNELSVNREAELIFNKAMKGYKHEDNR